MRTTMMRLMILLCLTALPATALEWKGETVPTSVKSENALAFLKFDLDFENKPGWIAVIKPRFQWKFFRGAGFEVNGANYANGSMSKKKNFTNGGTSSMIGLGYNFGPDYPITFTLGVGSGLGGNLDTRGHFSGATATSGGVSHDFFVQGRQKLRFSTLDFDLDYEFKNDSRWTPFVGVIGGISFLSYRNKLEVRDLTLGETYTGAQGKKKRVNLAGGARAGVKWDLNDRVGLSVYGSYTYLGEAPSQQFRMSDGGYASSKRINTHELDLKFGIKYQF